MMSYRVYNDELYHHGVQGMKWGVRRYQNEDGSLTEEGRIHYYGYSTNTDQSTTGITSKLNRTAKVMAKADVKSARAKYKASKYASKLRGDGSRRDERLIKKYEKANAKAAENDAVYNEGKQRTNELIKMAENNGYTVNSKEVSRYVDGGRDFLSAYLGGIGGMAVNEAIKYKGYSDTKDMRMLGVSKSNEYRVTNTQRRPEIGMFTEEEAKRYGLGENTRLSQEEESALWKELAKYYEEQEKNKR